MSPFIDPFHPKPFSLTASCPLSSLLLFLPQAEVVGIPSVHHRVFHHPASSARRPTCFGTQPLKGPGRLLSPRFMQRDACVRSTFLLTVNARPPPSSEERCPLPPAQQPRPAAVHFCPRCARVRPVSFPAEQRCATGTCSQCPEESGAATGGGKVGAYGAVGGPPGGSPSWDIPKLSTCHLPGVYPPVGLTFEKSGVCDPRRTSSSFALYVRAGLTFGLVSSKRGREGMHSTPDEEC